MIQTLVNQSNQPYALCCPSETLPFYFSQRIAQLLPGAFKLDQKSAFFPSPSEEPHIINVPMTGITPMAMPGVQQKFFKMVLMFKKVLLIWHWATIGDTAPRNALQVSSNFWPSVAPLAPLLQS